MTREIASINSSSGYSPSEPRAERAEDILRWAGAYDFRVELHGRDIRLIVLQEEHGNARLQSAQVELIKLVRPSLILDEGLKTGSYYDPEQDVVFLRDMVISSEEMSVPRTSPVVKRAKYLYDVAHALKVPVIACDLSLLELLKAVAPRLPRILKAALVGFAAVFGLDSVLERKLGKGEKGMSARDSAMVEKIISAVRGSSRPIIVIVGAAHLRNSHHLPLLQSQGVDYALIDQTNPESPDRRWPL